MSVTRALQACLGPEDVLETWKAPDGSELPAALPASEAACIELVRLARRDGLRVLPLGGGTRVGALRPIGRPDFALGTRRWSGITAYEPADGTLTARAGSTMAALSSTVHAGGHHLTPQVSVPEASTLGGVVAAGATGRDRALHGPVRHHVLGTRVLLADGRIAQSGGQLVKNVTGYDLHRLHCGSEGTLCVLLEVSLRLFARPEERRVLTAELDEEAAFAAARAVRQHALPCESVALERSAAGAWTWTVCCAGRAAGLADLTSELEGIVPEARQLTGAELDRALERLGSGGAARTPRLQLSASPGHERWLARTLLGAADAARQAGQLHVQPTLASATFALATSSAEVCAALHGQVAPRLLATPPPGLQWRWLDLPPECAHVARCGPGRPAAAVALEQRLREALDPTGVFGWDRDAGKRGD